MAEQDLPTYTSLEQLVRLIERGEPVFARWSRGPDADLADCPASRDTLTGEQMPGLSANPLSREEWSKDLPTALWAARRLYDYSHLRKDQGPGIRPWLLTGEVCGRGPDNEPLLCGVRPIAWIAETVIDQADAEVARQNHAWGPMRRLHHPDARNASQGGPVE